MLLLQPIHCVFSQEVLERPQLSVGKALELPPILEVALQMWRLKVAALQHLQLLVQLVRL